MAKTINGQVMFAEFEKEEAFDWSDPATGKVKTLRSLKVLISNGDKTVTRESLSLPEGSTAPNLTAEKAYGFPVKVKLNKKKMKVDYELRTDLPPFPAPEMG